MSHNLIFNLVSTCLFSTTGQRRDFHAEASLRRAGEVQVLGGDAELVQLERVPHIVPEVLEPVCRDVQGHAREDPDTDGVGGGGLRPLAAEEDVAAAVVVLGKCHR